MPTAFAQRLIAWQHTHGRHDLPWQRTRDAYRIWLSEIMLQQTQVSTVLGYYARFLARFPTVQALAAAPVDDVMALWSGLGYYSRARNLHACAQQVAALYDGRFPADPALLAQLPGIGRSTAAAIAVFAYGTRAAILDGNVKRVLARHAGIDGWTSTPAVERTLWAQAEQRLPTHELEAYTQGLMDLGATCCTRSQPTCLMCPVAADCIARREGRTDELPSPRPRRVLPERRCWVLVIRRGDDVLVEKRPAPGIWGGLWSLPQYDTWEDTQGAARDAMAGVAPSALVCLPERRHVFTHFALRLTPCVLPVPGPGAPLGELPAGRMWLSGAEVADAALPAPIKRLLRDLSGAAASAP